MAVEHGGYGASWLWSMVAMEHCGCGASWPWSTVVVEVSDLLNVRVTGLKGPSPSGWRRTYVSVTPCVGNSGNSAAAQRGAGVQGASHTHRRAVGVQGSPEQRQDGA